jgi:hypothetical protein
VNEHRPPVPIAIEQLVEALAELPNVLGGAAREAIPAVQAHLLEAMAARDRGDPAATLEAMGAAMERLAALADRLDPAEAALMRAVAANFRSALLRGDVPQAKQGMDVMFERSGAREKKKG